MTKHAIFRADLKLRGSAVVFVDWANVYGWHRKLGKEIDPRVIHSYLKSYPQIKVTNLYFGLDKNPKSRQFLANMKQLGFIVHTKPVKYIKTNQNPIVFTRKCDFDLEIAITALENIDVYQTFIFFSGDGDFAVLYEKLIRNGKNIVVIYNHGSLGREIWLMQKSVYLLDIKKLLEKVSPSTSEG